MNMRLNPERLAKVILVALCAFVAALLAMMALSGGAKAQALPVVSVTANVQVLSPAVVKAKYLISLPKGVYAGSVVIENPPTGDKVLYLGQGSILMALRAHQYAALSRSDALAVVRTSQRHRLPGFIGNNLPFATKLSDDVNVLIVSKALSVSPGVGLAVAGVSSALHVLAPDIEAQIAAVQQVYDTDGLQALTALAPGQSVVVTVLFDKAAAFKGAPPPATFPVPVSASGK